MDIHFSTAVWTIKLVGFSRPFNLRPTLTYLNQLHSVFISHWQTTMTTYSWRRGVAVTSLGVSTKLLYVGSG